MTDLFVKDLQLIDIERFSFDQLIPGDREALENPAKDSTAPEACQTLVKQFPLSFRKAAMRGLNGRKIVLWCRSRCQGMLESCAKGEKIRLEFMHCLHPDLD